MYICFFIILDQLSKVLDVKPLVPLFTRSMPIVQPIDGVVWKIPLVQDSLMCLAVRIFYFFRNYASSTEATCVLGVDKDNKKCFALFTGAAYR